MLPAGTIVGITILLHSVYSTYEWVNLHKQLGSQPAERVPMDVVIEIFLGLVVVVLCTVGRGISTMEPVKVTDLNVSRTLAGEETYAYLETRPNFQDLVGKRKAFLEWKRKESKPSQE